MKNREITECEKKRVLRYCEFVTLITVSILVNIRLAAVLLIAVPIIVPIIVGLKEKNYHFFQEAENEANLPIKSEICA